ncbi:hypothetical protein [uncultured Desulfovibrio sp.]|uniref:hypothetical protein n=1 Tax=uncultured Desulfovibrio sp. TaxID=167968 RepID=UPI001C3C013F|nr:hypothetical protein [uncultured Desulfovibrio sp.]HIX41032.1 hypothetical protein [Candidatus Desulfovibrio intestinigallinarum]
MEREQQAKRQKEERGGEVCGGYFHAAGKRRQGVLPTAGAADILEYFQFEMLRISNHTACRFAEKARFFRLLWAGRRCAAASRFTFFKGETL